MFWAFGCLIVAGGDCGLVCVIVDVVGWFCWVWCCRLIVVCDAWC